MLRASDQYGEGHRRMKKFYRLVLLHEKRCGVVDHNHLGRPSEDIATPGVANQANEENQS